MIVFGFDRDFTVTCAEDPGPVPIEWLRWIATETNHQIWAIGNQKLKHEAGIPGLVELRERLGMPPKQPSVMKARDPSLTGRQRNVNGKHKRLRFLQQAFPDASRYIAVDDMGEVGLAGAPWEFFLPDQFCTYWPELRASL